MTHEDFTLIEKELDIVLPERYKKIALEAPLRDTAFSDAFYDDPRKVIRTNIRLRKNGIYGSVPLRKNHLVVGFSLGEYAYIDVLSEDDVHYLADKTKTWHYMPDSSRNTMHVSLKGYVDKFLLFHEFDVRRKNNPPQQQDGRMATVQAHAFLINMWEDHKKKKETAKTHDKD